MEIKSFSAGRYISICFLSYAVLFLLLLICLSCAPEKRGTQPPDLIPHEEMVGVLTDLTLCEAALGGEPLAAFHDTLSRINVLKERGIAQERFLNSFRYYTEHPKELRSIYAEVVARLDPDSAKKASNR